MKKVKGKYIRMTEADLSKVVNDEVNRRILMIKQTKPKANRVAQKISEDSIDVIRNWCLVRYCTLAGITEGKERVKWELGMLMSKVSFHRINMEDTYKERLSYMREGFDVYDCFKGPKRLHDLVRHSFKKIEDNIGFDQDIYNAVLEDCANSIDDLIEMIIKTNYREKIKYVEEL